MSNKELHREFLFGKGRAFTTPNMREPLERVQELQHELDAMRHGFERFSKGHSVPWGYQFDDTI